MKIHISRKFSIEKCYKYFLFLVIIYNLANQMFYIYHVTSGFSTPMLYKTTTKTKSVFSSNIFIVSIFILKYFICLDYFDDRIHL